MRLNVSRLLTPFAERRKKALNAPDIFNVGNYEYKRRDARANLPNLDPFVLTSLFFNGKDISII